jgi:proliferating cell nuclear antigen
LEYKSIDIPDRNDDAVIVFPSSDYQNLVKDLSALGTEVYISADSDSVNFSVESDVGKGTYTIEYQEKGVECKEFEDNCSQLFSLKYLSNFSKPCSFCDQVEIRMKDQQPLIIRFPLPKMSDCLIDIDDNTNYGILLYFLAPKIEE